MPHTIESITAEIEAIGLCLGAIEDFEYDAQRRIVEYVASWVRAKRPRQEPAQPEAE